MSFDVKVSLFSVDFIDFKFRNNDATPTNPDPRRDGSADTNRSASFSQHSTTKTQTQTSKPRDDSEPEQPFDFFGFWGGMFPPTPVKVPPRRASTVPKHSLVKSSSANTPDSVRQKTVIPDLVYSGPTSSSATVSQSSTKIQTDAEFFLNFTARYEYRLNHQKTFDNFKEQLEDLNYLKHNFKKFTRIFKENVDNKVNFIRTLENLPTDDDIFREGRYNCITAARGYLNNPDQDLSFQQRTIEERIKKLTLKKPSSKIKTTYIEDYGSSEQMKAVIAERRYARRVAREHGIALQSISPEQRAQMRYDHEVQNNPNQSWSLPPSPNPNYDPLHVLDPDELAALPDKAINKGLKLAGKGVRQIQESDRYNKLKINVKHLWDSVKKPAEPSFMCKNGRTYSFAERWLWPKEQNEGSRRGGR
jgi:hypothetical protein